MTPLPPAAVALLRRLPKHFGISNHTLAQICRAGLARAAHGFWYEPTPAGLAYLAAIDQRRKDGAGKARAKLTKGKK